MNNAKYDSVFSSFRDPSGFLFQKDGQLFRQVNNVYKEHYSLLMNSGLYKTLVDSKMLIPHEEIATGQPKDENSFRVLKPEKIDFISYPYEWCFSQMKDAALTTLAIQNEALNYGMTLKDCSAYNIQFHKGRPLLIDTLSFEKYIEGRPWIAYRQFCQHFLAPLLLMSYKDIRLNQMLRIYIDGIPLDMASSLLPSRTRFSLPLLAHIHWHAKQQARYADKKIDQSKYRLSLRGFKGIIDQLTGLAKGLHWRPEGTEWADYYTDNNYTRAGFEHKKEIVAGLLNRLNPAEIWDLGANTGIFSRLAGATTNKIISFDLDPAAVELNYLQCVKEKENRILPLISDLCNPSPGIGWENRERTSLIERGPTETALALALVHHMAIANNIPLEKIAGFFQRICQSLIIEFVPKTDSQVQRLLASREDIFTEYTKECFESAFSKYFTIESSTPVKDSERTIYLMKAAVN